MSMIETDDILKFPILVGDIGGTNARFALLVDPHAEPKMFDIVQTSDFLTINNAIQEAVLDKTSLQPRTAVLAIAGPVDGDEIPLTNCPWVVKPRAMIADLGLEDVIIINDFEAQALAVVALDENNLTAIGHGQGELYGSRVVLGPGTGLGVAGLVHTRHAWVPVPGEGGHIDVGPRTDREREIFPYLEAIDGRISAEQLLCGRGLVNIYRAIVAARGGTGIYTLPAEISIAGLDGSNKDAAEAVDLFSVFLGRVAGDMALVFMARGGVFLAGGISQHILPALQRPGFRAAFNDKAPHSELMANMPIYVVTHPTAALVGLGAFAKTPSRFGVAIENRRWRN